MALEWQVIAMSLVALFLQLVISLRSSSSTRSEGVNGRALLADKVLTAKRERGSLAE
jgi:hypothetical protein